MKPVFPIVKKLTEVDNFFDIIATGFFIDNNGYFVTTGHTFKNNGTENEGYFICDINDEDVKLIHIVHHEKCYRKQWKYEETENPRTPKIYQYGPEFKDVAVGKVDLSNTPYLTFQKRKPYEWNKLICNCYNKNKINCPEGRFKAIGDTTNSNKFEYNERSFKLIKRDQPARIPNLGEKHEYANIDLYNNCMELEGEAVRTNSGAPILNEYGKVIGIFCGGKNIKNDREKLISPLIVLSSSYVNKISRKLKKKIMKSIENRG